MSSSKSGKFFVGSIVTLLIVFGLIKVILSSMQDIEKHTVTAESMTNKDITKRIKPLAEVYIGKAPVVAAAAPVAAETTAGGGAKIVTQVCSMCHATGMMGSPKLGNKDNWAPRIAKGVDTLYSHALNGFNMMPAHGGRPDLSDDQIKSAVDYMVSLVK